VAKRLSIITAMVLLPLIGVGPVSAANPLYGHNLIVNGNAEAGAGLPGNGEMPGWTGGVIAGGTGGTMATVQYGYDSYPKSSDPGPKQRGTNFFAGVATEYGGAFQSIDVSAAAADIDAGAVHYALSGYLGGFANQADYATLHAQFFNPSSTELGAATIGPVTVQQRKSVTGLWYRVATGTLPVGTRRVFINPRVRRFEGGTNDGYLDNLSFVLTKKKAH
jgi:hypothetical protein